MKTFSAQVIHQLFTLSWSLALLTSQFSVLAGILVGLLSRSLFVGSITGAATFILLLSVLGKIFIMFFIVS